MNVTCLKTNNNTLILNFICFGLVAILPPVSSKIFIFTSVIFPFAVWSWIQQRVYFNGWRTIQNLSFYAILLCLCSVLACLWLNLHWFRIYPELRLDYLFKWLWHLNNAFCRVIGWIIPTPSDVGSGFVMLFS